MVTNGYIKEADKTAALAETLTYAPQKDSLGGEAPHYAQIVLNQLIEKYGEETALRSGFQVQTTINLDTQQTVKDSIANNLAYIQRNGGSNASAIVIDPKTGEVRAYVGSADWNNDKWGKVDMVSTARQPGTGKPRL
jgi:membrane peptidoglycan carboxypeptidase